MLSKKEEKRLYDIEYRRKNKERIAERNRKYNCTPEGRVAQKRQRDRRMPKHIKYCQQDWYKLYKKDYDRIHGAKKHYGVFWECMLLAGEIEQKVRELVPDKYERLKMRGKIERNIAKRALKRSIEFGWNFNYIHIIDIK